jgi:hypothetical protein
MPDLNTPMLAVLTRRSGDCRVPVDAAASMGERTAMMRIGTLVAIAAFGVMLATPSLAEPAAKRAQAQPAPLTDISAQARRKRPEIRVTPRRYPYRHFHSWYPLPYTTEAPGPNAVRRCAGRLVAEARPSGTVIVPRTRCWWAPG